jgi:hypothetical protein
MSINLTPMLVLCAVLGGAVWGATFASVSERRNAKRVAWFYRFGILFAAVAAGVQGVAFFGLCSLGLLLAFGLTPVPRSALLAYTFVFLLAAWVGHIARWLWWRAHA